MTELHGRDILQIDATIITGVLILLTISVAGDHATQIKKDRLVGPEIFKIIWTVGIIFPFAISAILVLNQWQKPTPDFRWTIGIMKIGFIYAMIGIGGIAAVQINLILSS